jgi:hypothetical protein
VSDIQKPGTQKSAGDRSTGHGTKPDAVRQKAIVGLLSEPTIGAAAAVAGVSERTLRRWLTDDAEFKAQYEEARQATFLASISRIQALAGKAADALEDLLAAKEHPSVRLGAARTVTEIGLHQRDADLILRKLDEIEAAQRRRPRG